jgi:hypothetical protein
MFLLPLSSNSFPLLFSVLGRSFMVLYSILWLFTSTLLILLSSFNIFSVYVLISFCIFRRQRLCFFFFFSSSIFCSISLFANICIFQVHILFCNCVSSSDLLVNFFLPVKTYIYQFVSFSLLSNFFFFLFEFFFPCAQYLLYFIFSYFYSVTLLCFLFPSHLILHITYAKCHFSSFFFVDYFSCNFSLVKNFFSYRSCTTPCLSVPTGLFSLFLFSNFNVLPFVNRGSIVCFYSLQLTFLLLFLNVYCPLNLQILLSSPFFFSSVCSSLIFNISFHLFAFLSFFSSCPSKRFLYFSSLSAFMLHLP